MAGGGRVERVEGWARGFGGEAFGWFGSCHDGFSIVVFVVERGFDVAFG